MKKHIYIIDDSKTILKHAEGLLVGAYKVSMFESGRAALEQMMTETPDLVLLDINMPGLNGYEVFQYMQDSKRLRKIPVIFLTADTSQESEIKGLEMGAMDYITKPFSPMVMQTRISRILELDGFRKQLENLVDAKTDEIQKTFIQSITTIAYAIDAKDRYTKGHSVRVAQYCLAIVKKLNWSQKDCLNMYFIALLHDIGKIGIPDSILNKPVKLTDEEYRLIRSHTTKGASILQPITMVPQISDGAMYHHERYDGKGYPKGLKGDEIPYVARIIGIADAYDAITSNRIYEKAQINDYAISELQKGKGTQFDPYLTDIMLDLVKSDFHTSNEPQFEFEHTSVEGEDYDSFIVEVCKKTEADPQKSFDVDYLTNFPIRKDFEHDVDDYLDNPLEHGVMFLMDIDNFFYANENYGHVAGDHIICILADVLRSNSGEDTHLCRISGDEFAVFYPHKHTTEWMEDTARAVIYDFKNAIADIDVNKQLSLSIAITYTQNPRESCRNLLHLCSKVLYYIKHNGKNSFQIMDRTKNSLIESREKSAQIDLAQLKGRLVEDCVPVGAYKVDYGNFEKIYQLVARSLSRSKKGAQIVLFSLTENLHGTMDITDLNEAMDVLERCIIGSLRKGDVTTRYSSSQQVVIMIDAMPENGHMIAERIIANYSRMYDNYNVELSYNIDEITAKTTETA